MAWSGVSRRRAGRSPHTERAAPWPRPSPRVWPTASRWKVPWTGPMLSCMRRSIARCGWAAGGSCSERVVQRMFEPQVPRPGLGKCLVGAALALACSTDTSGLARQPTPGVEAGGASGGFAPPEAEAGTGGSAGSGTGGSGGGSAGGGGVGALHVVHGLVDGGDLFVCLREAGGAALGADTPQPEAALAVEALLYVVAGGLAGRSCSELGALSQIPAPTLLDAGAGDAAPAAPEFPLEPFEPRAAGSVRFPPGLLRAGTSYALVAAGCTGAGASEDVCGPPDLIFGSSQALALAKIDDQIVGAGGGSLGLQFLNASRAVARASVVLQGQVEQDSRRLA